MRVELFLVVKNNIYIYQTLLSKATYIAFKLQFYILSALAFPGNRTHDLGIASAMLYHLSYRKAGIFINEKCNAYYFSFPLVIPQ